MAAVSKNSDRNPIGGMGQHNLLRIFQTAVTVTPRVGSVVWSRERERVNTVYLKIGFIQHKVAYLQ